VNKMGAAAAAIITGIVSAIAGGVKAGAASKAAKEEEALREEERKREEELFKKDRALKERQQNMEGLNYLAAQRQQATQYDATRQFNRDAVKAFGRIRGASGVPAQTAAAPAPMTAAPQAQRGYTPKAAPLQTGRMQTQSYSPGGSTMGTSTMGTATRRAA
jgi:flavin-dependent dehydrogenase